MPESIAQIARFSEAVGLIYDCALDPARWPEAIREVCEATNCIAGAIAINDLTTGAGLLQQYWNFDQHWLDRMVLYGPEVAEMLASVPDLHTRSIDEPFVALRDIDPVVLRRSRYYTEWVRPQGIIDAFNLIILRHCDRIGSLALSRHESVGPIADPDVEILRLLAPHIRRAVTIADVLEMQAVTVGTFEASLDVMAAPVVLVDRNAKIVHANRAARSMFEKGSPLRFERGDLRAYRPETMTALKKAIAKSDGNEGAIGAAGIGIPAPQPSGNIALIHVLPLARGDLRARIAPRASAALFITPADNRVGDPAGALAALYDLSPAEMRVTERLLAGDTLTEAARRLGIAVATCKTHLAHIFEKTETSRQGELIGLAAKFCSPAGWPSRK